MHVISGDENRRRGLALGAMTYLEKSVTKDNLNAAFDTIHQSLRPRAKKLLIVAAEEARLAAWRELLGGKRRGDSRRRLWRRSPGSRQNNSTWMVSCIDLRLPDIPAMQLAEEIQAEAGLQTPPDRFLRRPQPDAPRSSPISGGSSGRASFALPNRMNACWKRPSCSCIAPIPIFPTISSALLAAVRQNDATLAGKKVLVVDDDVRNIFALTSVLEQHNLQVVHAENGRAGIETLLKTPGVDGVLMDIMMPEMDGYETMRAIRQIAEFRTLPIIAVTAKAMKGDRAKCIEAGASDYITKPVDLEQLFSVLRVWLVRSHEPSKSMLAASR